MRDRAVISVPSPWLTLVKRVRVLDKGLGFAPTPTKINETDPKADFNEFARKMRCKWFFRIELTENFSEPPAFHVKSNWNPPRGHPAIEFS